ncbi:MAG TPA: DUF3089 domain-containing protein [Methanocorpusculum sp.]|nr:DUF3089 domain-containing protein [Methanocorpusculum sp.]
MNKVLFTGTVILVLVFCIMAAGCVSQPVQPTPTPTPTPEPTQESQMTIEELRASSPKITEKDIAAASAVKIDYSDMNNWMYYPQTHEHAVDTFFLYPTATADDKTCLYTPIDDAGMRANAHKQYVDDGSQFEGITDVYAPYYRQVSPQVLAGCTADEFANLVGTIPKQDAFAALDYYFEHANKGGERPFILAAYSQGSFTTRYILAEYMKEHPEYYKNMVAAYVIGCPVTKEYIAANPHLKAATGETDTGVIVSWTVEEPGATVTDNFVWDENMYVINPLNWKTDETYAGVSENKGSMITNEDGTQTLGTGLADAQLDLKRNVVVCTTVKSLFAGNELMDYILGTKSLHLKECSLYYMNMHENAEKRIAAFLNQA